MLHLVLLDMPVLTLPPCDPTSWHLSPTSVTHSKWLLHPDICPPHLSSASMHSGILAFDIHMSWCLVLNTFMHLPSTLPVLVTVWLASHIHMTWHAPPIMTSLTCTVSAPTYVPTKLSPLPIQYCRLKFIVLSGHIQQATCHHPYPVHGASSFLSCPPIYWGAHFGVHSLDLLTSSCLKFWSQQNKRHNPLGKWLKLRLICPLVQHLAYTCPAQHAHTRPEAWRCPFMTLFIRKLRVHWYNQAEFISRKQADTNIL